MNYHRDMFSKIFWIFINVLFFIWYCIFSIVIGILVLPVNFFVYRAWKKEGMHLSTRRFVQLYGRCVIRLSWPLVRFRIENIQAVEKVEPCIFIVNHSSLVDVYFCGFLPGYQTTIAIRSWPFKIPILNIFMRLAGYLDVEATSWENTLSYAASIIKSGGCMLFFPEGHRSSDGSIQPFGKGAFRIAAENNVPIVPVILEGTEYLAGYKSRLLKPTTVTMRFLAPVKAGGKDFAAVNDFRNRIEDIYRRERGGK